MIEHPYIDFDGDGHGDHYDTLTNSSGEYEFVHHDSHGHVDAVAYDVNHDGRIDSMDVDRNHDGVMDHHLTDTNGDGIMDSSQPISNSHLSVLHPYIDFNGDGHGDRYYTDIEQGEQVFYHTDGHGHVDAKAFDFNHDGRIDEMLVDEDHDGHIDTELRDTNGDGIMDVRFPA
jgi:hypothetical protein